MKKKLEIQIGQKVIQGDVKLVRVASLPTNATEVKGTILQQSETTGHHHFFPADSTVKIYETGKKETSTITPDYGKFVWVNSDTVLYHGVPTKDRKSAVPGSNDHHPIEIPEGIYEVVITREYDYDRDEIIEITD